MTYHGEINIPLRRHQDSKEDYIKPVHTWKKSIGPIEKRLGESVVQYQLFRKIVDGHGFDHGLLINELESIEIDNPLLL